MPSKEEELFQERLSKLQRLRDRGVDPYPARFKPSHTSVEARQAFEATEATPATDAPGSIVRVAGRVTALRRMGKASFFDVQDGAGRMQVFAQRDKLPEADW